MRRLFVLLCAGFVCPGLLTAQVVTSPRPQARAVLLAVDPVALPAIDSQQFASDTIIALSPRPKPHPAPWPQEHSKPAEGTTALPDSETALAAVAPRKKDKASPKGSVCGDPSIKGEKLARIKSGVTGCGVAAPVRVTSIDGIRLSQPATMECDTASALKTWIRKGLRPALGRREVVELSIAAHYICRPRNNVKGAQVSEHGRGKAIDISGFVFADGTSWSVEGDYNKHLRKAQKAACGIFGTTLGPGSDGRHEDHFHFDTASHRSGPYCR